MDGDFLSRLTRIVVEATQERLKSWGCAELASEVSLQRPAVREHGDLAINLALVAAARIKQPPRELAGELVADLKSNSDLQLLIERIDIAGPGFINFFISSATLAKAARETLALGASFGSGQLANPKKILLEFVSANPTGPLHVGHARYAAYGDTLRRLLDFAGHEVTTEFYINDFGSQMDIFGKSLAARYGEALGLNVKFPEDGYQGAYPKHIAKKIQEEIGDKLRDEVTPPISSRTIDYFKKKGCDIVLTEMQEELKHFRVSFDNWFSETTLHDSSEVKKTIKKLQESGDVVDMDGALWLLTTHYGDDKDRVLIRRSGEPTYFASDIAYHKDKLSRGYDLLINVWGADHHGYVPRMKAAFQALAHNPERLEIIIGQLVNVIERGEKKQMSKRAGAMVTLKELLESIGVDAARFFLVDRSHDSTLDLDLEKAKLKSEENPVYYVQYAHARICSILRKAETKAHKRGGGEEYITLESSEKDLILKILEFPQIIQAAVAARGPQRLTAYARELAQVFHIFYHNCPVIKAQPPEAAAFRLDLCRLTKNVIARSLNLLGVSAPESM